MLLEPRSKSAFVQQVMTLPPEKRRVVILAGRHLNEGSRNLAVRHHAEWERHGAVTVLIPAEWTPHGFWHDMKLLARSKGKPVDGLYFTVRRKAARVPSDEELIALLQRHGQEVPVLNLHGESNAQPGLKLFLQREAPNWLQKAVNSVVAPDEENVALYTQYSEESVARHPMEVLVEHSFRGRPKKTRPLVSNRGVPHGQLVSNYLKHRRATKTSLARFDRDHLDTINQLLHRMAQAERE